MPREMRLASQSSLSTWTLTLLANLDVLLDGLLAVAHAIVRDIGDVDEAIEPADIDERAEGHDLADGALEDLALGEGAP
jgi:hypothetical protein